MKNRIFGRNFFKYLFISWCFLILFLTSYPKLTTPTEEIIGLDKIAHFTIYLVFSFLFLKMFPHEDRKKNLKTLCFLAVFVPLFDELHQIPIPGRDFSVYDILADMLGFAVIYLIFRFRKNGI